MYVMPSSIKVITYATGNAQYFNELQESAIKFNYNLTVLGMGNEWKGFIDKLTHIYKYISETLDDSDIVMCIDAYDVIFCRDSSEFEKIYMENFDYENKILFNAEALSNSFIMNEFWYKKFNPPNKTETKDFKYKYLNAGVCIGMVKNVKAMMADILGREGITDDQVEIMKTYSQNDTNIEIDHGCKLFNTVSCLNNDLVLNESCGIYNSHTSTYPCLIHGPGQYTTIDTYVNWAGLNSVYKKSNLKRNLSILLNYYFDYIVAIIVIIIIFIIVCIATKKQKPV